MARSFLIDTNVVSELARQRPDPGVIAFIAAQPRVYVSTILFHEMVYGVEVASPDQKPRLMTFLAGLKERFGPSAIPVDIDIAETAGRLRAFERSRGRILTVADSLIAATAMVRNLGLATRNTKDFATLGLDLINPFSAP